MLWIFTLIFCLPYFCWPAEHIKSPHWQPHCPVRIRGRERTFCSQSSTAMRQYETLIMERSGLGYPGPGHLPSQVYQQCHSLDERLTLVRHSATIPTCTRAKLLYWKAEQVSELLFFHGVTSVKFGAETKVHKGLCFLGFFSTHKGAVLRHLMSDCRLTLKNDTFIRGQHKSFLKT